jgi:putative peptidoglycan binding protein
MPESASAHGVMNARFEQEPFSVPEFAAGGIALAAVALIAFIGVRTSQPQNLSPVDPPSSVAVRQWDAASTAASLERLRRPSDGGGMSREWRSFSPEAGSGVPQMQETLSPPAAERNPLNRFDATSIQKRLHDLGYYFGDGNGVWGAASRKALRDFKSMNGIQDDDRWDRETEERLLSRPAVRAARTFIGGWALEAGECRHREGSAQLIIHSHGAEAAGGKCDFRSIKQEAASRWRIRAVCSAAGQAWNANIDLSLIGPNLRWSSERGTETYVRCLKR